MENLNPAPGRTSADPGVALSIAAILIVGAALTFGFFAFTRHAAERRAIDAADLLARDALRTFADAEPGDRLARMPVGGDSIMARARVRTEGDLSGAAIVLVRRSSESTYLIKSTGRLDTSHGPIICSVDVAWHADDVPGFAVPQDVATTCNGKRREPGGPAVGLQAS